MTQTATAKHTPGPWIVDDGGDGEIEIWAPAVGNDTIAHIGPGLDASAEDHANARLIASAPDLLAACEAAESALTEYWSNKGIGYVFEVLEQVRAAITKARGGAA